MGKRDDGGQAFPISDASGPLQYGLTARDWFAGRAITGLLAADVGEDEWVTYEAMVKQAWAVADLMLAERTKNTSGG
jgi:hypothetical protein